MTENRLPTYIRGLDERIEGGIPEGHICLIAGRAGTMKSSIAYWIMYNNALKNKQHTVYFTIEQSRKSILKQMTKFGLSEKLQSPDSKSGSIMVVDLAKLRKDILTVSGDKQVDWFQAMIKSIRGYKEMYGLNIVTIDSLGALYSIATITNPREQLFYFFEGLRELELTIFLISEVPADSSTFGVYGVEDFLADGVLYLEAQRSGTTVNLFLQVFKLRETKHDRHLYPLIADKNQIEIVTD